MSAWPDPHDPRVQEDIQEAVQRARNSSLGGFMSEQDIVNSAVGYLGVTYAGAPGIDMEIEREARRQLGGDWTMQDRRSGSGETQSIEPMDTDIESVSDMDTPGGDQVSTYLPDDFFQNPSTARIWTSACPGADPRDLVACVTANMPGKWTFDELEYYDTDIPGQYSIGTLGHAVLYPRGVLYALVASQVNPGLTPLSISFGNDGYWRDDHPIRTMEWCVQALNDVLRQRYGTFGGRIFDVSLHRAL